MPDINSVVYIIDDDDSVRKSIALLLNAKNYQTESFKDSAEFFENLNYERTGCLILDVHLVGENGFDLQKKLIELSSHLPIIFISGKGDIPMTVQALKDGAINFLTKPFDINVLIKSIEEAFTRSIKLKSKYEEQKQIKSLFATLTDRELEVFRLVITGLLNKQIASELNIAEHTVKLHRGKITEKLGVKSVAELVLLAEKIKL
jgi:FixJ family two-component response regulator